MVDSSSNSKTPKFKLAICGSGIGGTSLAYMIQQGSNDIDVHLYEAAPYFGEIGAGLSVWPRTLKIFEAVGLRGGENGYEKHATFPPADAKDLAYCFRKSDLPNGFTIFNRRIEGGLTSLHRAKLLDLFASKIPKENIHFNKRLLSLSQSISGVHLEFEDGSTTIADALVGADGVNSIVRKQILKWKIDKLDESEEERREDLKRLMNPYWSRTIAYRSLINLEQLRSLDPTHPSLTKPHHWCGRGKHIVTYPIDSWRFINFVTCNRPPDLAPDKYEDCYPHPPKKEDLEAEFIGWEPAIQSLMKCIGSPTRWPILYSHPSKDWVEGSVVVAGDAAHAMAPHNASGAGMAIEDAFVLSGLLTHPSCTSETLPLALKAFETSRIQPIHRAMHSSHACGYIYEFLGKNGDDLTKFGPDIDELTSWIGEFDPDTIRKDAIHILTDLIHKGS